MLQEKKKYSAGCIRLSIFLIIGVFLIWSGLIIVLIFIGFFLFGGNKKNKVDFNKILESIGIYDCVKHLFGDFEDKGKDNYGSKKYEGGIPKQEQNYLERINEAIKNRSEALKKKEEYINKNKDKSFDEKIKDLEEFGNNKEIKDDKKIVNNTFSNISTKSTNSKNNGFNGGKSVWDDYESVIDIMKKKK